MLITVLVSGKNPPVGTVKNFVHLLNDSNLDFDEWTEAFAVNRLLASATIDRLRHNAYCLELDGVSYRDPQVPPTSKKTPPKPPINAAK